jgi:hypothetical protein
MDNTFLRKHWLFILILSGYILCIVAADPRGEFPLNDDWSYIRTAFSLGSGRGLRIDPWSAPSLVGQALYGGLLVKLFSPDFLVLRLSTILLSCGTALLLWAASLRMGLRRDYACVLLLAWLCNPIQFNLSFTWMTEIPFLFFIGLAVYLAILYFETQKPGRLILSAAVLGYTYMIRQTALLFILALLCGILTDSRRGFGARIRHCGMAGGASGIFIAGYYAWVLTHGGATAAVHRKFELLDYLTARQLAGNSYGMLFYLAFMTLPVLLILIPSMKRMIGAIGVKPGAGIVLAWTIAALAGVWWFEAQYIHAQYLPSTAYHARMPYLLNVLYDTGLGPITLDPAYFGPSPTPIYPEIWIGITVLVAAGAIILGSSVTIALIGWLRACAEITSHSAAGPQALAPECEVISAQALRNGRSPGRRALFTFLGMSFLLLVLFEIVFSHIQEGGLFDRHILGAAFPLALWLGLIFGSGEKEERRATAGGLPLAAAGIVLAALMLFSVGATHDYMAWNRIRWDMGRELLAQGVNPLTIVGGFEFNAWENYDTFLARGNIAHTHHWWYDSRDYLISMSLQVGCDVLQKREYYSWVHRRPVPLYLLRAATQNSR